MNIVTPCVERDKPEPPPGGTRENAVDDPERIAMVDVLKEQVRKGVYRPDVRDLARALASMMVRQL